ncbi:MAG: electron transfer flavoprotein subunit alpha/FixB family protein [Flavobacteriia bacterium]|jgi:electron transfer flavoprotein alpha subunit|nr:electron transfer flavoprotein subunit alpha/FixB family protein [Flavobacteriia bacterium]NBP29112.1 electron transfer flavoprotein subunit alpha/FixB family protein [Flavobacteriia bacterium]
MKNIVYIQANGALPKAAFEVVSYAHQLGGTVTVLATGSLNSDALSVLGSYGANEVIVNRAITGNDDQTIAAWLAQHSAGAHNLVFSHDFNGKAIAPRLSVKLKAGFISGAVALPEADGSIKVNVFSGKAFGFVKSNTAQRIISLLPNSVAPSMTGNACTVQEVNESMGDSRIKVLSVKKPEGTIPLPEAELVVSAGRGLKGPENWGMIEDLADALGAATACSRPVADIGWRPHHEHVGQTGVAIRPNLYIAVGISGAIQHLAGVNGSKVIVVINPDSEAPFFKAADYGVVGDAFEVVPKLVEAVKKFRANS